MAGRDKVQQKENISWLLPGRNRGGQGLRPGGDEVSRGICLPEFSGIRQRLSVVLAGLNPN